MVALMEFTGLSYPQVLLNTGIPVSLIMWVTTFLWAGVVQKKYRESPDKEALAVYAFRDEGRPETLEAFPGDVGDGTPWDGKGPASPRWLPFRRQPLTGAPTVTAACPVYTSDRRQAGITVLDTNIFEIQKLVTTRGLPSSLTADVLDGAGTARAGGQQQRAGRVAVAGGRMQGTPADQKKPRLRDRKSVV